MLLGIPVQDGHDLTNTFLDSLKSTVYRGLHVVIIDNGSTIPYQEGFYDYKGYPFKVDVIRNPQNIGYYAPLKQLAEAYPEEGLVGLVHNDMVIYEQGWNERMAACFDEDPELMLVGLCGSYEVDERGGRGGGTHVNFRGEAGYQSPGAGAKYVGLVPAACLDSLFMMFRREALAVLNEDWDNLPLAHFYDRIWPLRLVEAGYHVAAMGVECDHMGGMTTVANVQYAIDCKRWFDERGLPYDNPETEMYLLAERRYLGEYRDQKQLIPCKIGGDYAYHKL